VLGRDDLAVLDDVVGPWRTQVVDLVSLARSAVNPVYGSVGFEFDTVVATAHCNS
jgi:hypothetical protein